MDIKSMHYEFKLGFNKLDSNDRREYLVPEIDVLLNIAQDKFINRHIPYFDRNRGVEFNQRSIENLRTLVVKQQSWVPITNHYAQLPQGYRYYISSHVLAKSCGEEREIRTTVYQHDDVLGEFDSPSYEWGHVPIRFTEQGVRVYSEGFSVSGIRFTFLRHPKWMHNAEDWNGSGYNYNGETYTGTQDCELPEIAHREIVDLAVMLAAESSDSPVVDNKMQRLQLNN